MAEVTSELMYELLKREHERFDKVDSSIVDIKNELNNLRGTMIAMQGDIHNIYGVLARHDDRLGRIEHRLDLRELAEAQAHFERGQ